MKQFWYRVKLDQIHCKYITWQVVQWEEAKCFKACIGSGKWNTLITKDFIFEKELDMLVRSGLWSKGKISALRDQALTLKSFLDKTGCLKCEVFALCKGRRELKVNVEMVKNLYL